MSRRGRTATSKTAAGSTKTPSTGSAPTSTRPNSSSTAACASPKEGTCECDLYLTCAKFVTTPQYGPRLRERLCVEHQLIADARARGWEREVDRYQLIANRIEALLDELDEPHASRDVTEPRS